MNPAPLGYHLPQLQTLSMPERQTLQIRFALDCYRMFGRYPPKRNGSNVYSPYEVKMVLALRALDQALKARIQIEENQSSGEDHE
jgi:hypothetical protein